MFNMSRLALMLIALALSSSVGRCGEVYVERDASGKPTDLVHNGSGDQLVAFLRDKNNNILFPTIKTVRLLQHQVDADEINSLIALKSLQYLELGDHPDEVTLAAGALSQIGHLPTIEHLSIHGTGPVNDFDWLDSLHRLRSLTLSSSCLYTRDVFQRIGELRTLESLSVRCRFPITEFDWMRALTQLEQLDLCTGGVTAGDFSAFAALNKLKSLSVSGHKFSNRDLLDLAKHVGDRLEFLSIDIDGECMIETFTRFSALKKLVARRANATVRSPRTVDTTLVFEIPEGKEKDGHNP